MNNLAPPPRGLGLHLTHRCNLRCRMCWYWGNSGSQPVSKELSTNEVKLLLDKVAGLKPIISMGGGEPLMRDDLLEILEYAHQKGARCEVLTNGTLITPELAKGLVKWAYVLTVSLEGSQEINDSIRGKGNFDKAVRGIRLIHEAGNIKTRINATVSSLNVAHLDELVDIASESKCALSFQHLIYGEGDNFHELDTNLLIEKLGASRERAGELKMHFHTTPFLRGDKEIELWYSTLKPIFGLSCPFIWAWLFVQPDGEVQPCEFIDYSYGNIIKEDLETIWNGEKARSFRTKGLLPECRRCCKLEPGGLNGRAGLV